MKAWTLGWIAGFGCAALGSGCGSTASESPPPSSTPPAEEPSPEEQAPTPTPVTAEAAAAPTFDVHEWGLVDVPVNGPTEIGAGPGQPDMPLSVRKPVVYVHADPGTAPFPIDVVARFPSGELLEHWPTASEWSSTSTNATSVTWSDVMVGGCSGTTRTLTPTQREARACTAPDGYCEVNDLPSYVASDATCLSSSGLDATLLFYRGRTTSAQLPLAVQASGANVSVTSSMPGGSALLHVRDGRGIELPWPTPNTATPLPTETTESLDGTALTRRLASLLGEAGLSSPEVDAFMRAWSQPLFQTAWPLENETARRDLPARGRFAVSAPAPALIYVMPEASVASLAELRIEPRPRSVRRVMVVRVDLPR